MMIYHLSYRLNGCRMMPTRHELSYISRVQIYLPNCHILMRHKIFRLLASDDLLTFDLWPAAIASVIFFREFSVLLQVTFAALIATA